MTKNWPIFLVTSSVTNIGEHFTEKIPQAILAFTVELITAFFKEL